MERNKILMIVIIALLVILLGAMVFIGIQVVAMATGGGGDAVVLDGPAPALSVEELTLVEMSAPIATNLRIGESGRSHLISTRFSVAIDNTQGRDSQNIVDLMTASDSITRSIALHAVRSRTFEELSHPDAMSILEQDILENLRREFNSNLIHRVFIAGDWYLES